MNSRAGAQVPFSSINYGTDTNPEGRLVTKQILLALDAGLDRHETAIFPIHIFKVKEGVNYNPEDPNYDLFKLAIKIAAHRIYPNFSFIDAPFNLPYYKPGRPETEVSYMGCVQGDELITYKIGDMLFIEGIGRAYKRLTTIFTEQTQGASKYMDTSASVSIWDSNANKFVRCDKFIMNPDLGNWSQIKLDNGRGLLATADHPLPVKGKGRTQVKDIKIGDQIPVTYKQYSKETKHATPDEAWLLGLLLCDSSYADNITISLGQDETDIINKLEHTASLFGFTTSKHLQSRGAKGTYYDINLKCDNLLKDMRIHLNELFEGEIKIERQIPAAIFSCDCKAKLAFLQE
jgi:hypothetical protein